MPPHFEALAFSLQPLAFSIFPNSDQKTIWASLSPPHESNICNLASILASIRLPVVQNCARLG